ncbi:hypothetical protein [Cohnella panacarvi]|uniref:hypothetical protein n=1 Tax=Cohnella panacarvi TaxID=400776 RepID=UPI00047B5FC8|nr:hypothetical protein [Cohnella panacarvi]
MRYPMTLACTLFAVALCLFNATGYDPHNLFLFMFSIPVWLTELFTDIHNVNVWFIYVLTVLSWALIGYLGDLGISRTRARRQS